MAKRSKTTTKSRTFKKPYVARVAFPMFSRCPFPPMLGNQLTYCEQTTITLAAGAFNKHLVSANGCYDPNITGTGNQPLYFDQLSAVYNHYTVTSSYIEFTVAGASTQHNQLTMCIYIDDDTSTVTSSASAMQRPGAVFKIVDSTIDSPPPLRLGWNCSKAFGTTTPWATPDLKGSVSANPAEQQYFVFSMTDATVQSVTYALTFKVVYNVVWDELATVAIS